MFVLKSFTEYNTGFMYHKKGKWTRFLFEIQNICFNGSNASICFQKYGFCGQKNKFPTVKEFPQSQGIFPQLRIQKAP